MSFDSSLVFLDTEEFNSKEVLEALKENPTLKDIEFSNRALNELSSQAKTLIHDYRDIAASGDIIDLNHVINKMEFEKVPSAESHFNDVINDPSTQHMNPFQRWRSPSTGPNVNADFTGYANFVLDAEPSAIVLLKSNMFLEKMWLWVGTFTYIFVAFEFLMDTTGRWTLLLFYLMAFMVIIYLLRGGPLSKQWLQYLLRKRYKHAISIAEYDDYSTNLRTEPLLSRLELEWNHLSHLSLGQYFQPKNHLYQMVGFVSSERSMVLVLRKKIRGTSEIVDDLIVRTESAKLHYLSVEEFVSIYLGVELNKLDDWWSNRLVAPKESW